jgi:ABC-type bacteriocin/lantibiotic exporter with double-glycine peptidase domain
MTPFTRLLKLLRPERSDISAVVVFAFVVGVLSLATPITVEALVNSVAFGRYLQPLLVLAAMLLVFLGFASLLKGLQAFIVEIIQRRIFVRVVAELADRLPRVKREAFDGAHGPELLNRFFEVITVQKSAATLVLDGLSIVITAIIGMLVLAFYHPYLLGFDLVLMAAIAFTVFILGRGAVDSAIEESYKKYAVASWLEQLANFPLAFRLQGGPEHAFAKADQLAAEYIEARRAHFKVLFRQIVFTLGLQAIAGTALLGIGGFLVINGQLTLGQLVASELIVAIVVGSFAKLGKHMESYYDLLAAVDKLGHLFDLATEREEGISPPQAAQGAQIQLHQLTLDSDSGDCRISGLSLLIEAGSRVAVSGPPGSGKSELLEVLYALRDPTGGYVEYDDHDVRSLQPSALRKQVALVHQPEVFEGSVVENIQMNRPGITHGDIRRSLEALGMWQEVMSLPCGLETQLSRGGGPLTDSQIIRLMLARAIAGRPRLLLIDSVLDQLPDSQLRGALEAVAGNPGERTLILVTGREALLGRCDRVLDLTPSGDAGDSDDQDGETSAAMGPITLSLAE